MGLFKRFLQSEDGFAAVEYAALVSALAIVSAMTVDAVDVAIDRLVEHLDVTKTTIPLTK
jgi:Flp pilus assembly pilin Flp